MRSKPTAFTISMIVKNSMLTPLKKGGNLKARGLQILSPARERLTGYSASLKITFKISASPARNVPIPASKAAKT